MYVKESINLNLKARKGEPQGAHLVRSAGMHALIIHMLVILTNRIRSHTRRACIYADIS